MKVFVSWSGDYTKAVASALTEWLRMSIQQIEEVFYSPEIEKGIRGLTEITRALSSSSVGIICLTRDNISSEWINFEAGALSNIENTNVYTLLFNALVSDVSERSPLRSFQHTLFEKDDFYKIIKSINSKLDRPMETLILQSVYELWWPILEERINSIPKIISQDNTTIKEQEQDEKSILEEILSVARRLDTRQQNAPPDRIENELWQLKIDYERMVEGHINTESLVYNFFLERTKPATQEEIQRWYTGAGIDVPHHHLLRDIRYAAQDFILPVLYGAKRTIVIVEAGVKVYRGRDIGHSQILYMDGFRKEGTT